MTKARRTILAVITIVILCFVSFSSITHAEETPEVIDETKYTPVIKLSSSATVSIKAGETTDVKIKIKNVGTSRGSNILVQAVPAGEDVPFSVTVSKAGSNVTVLNAGSEGTYNLKFVTEKRALPKTYAITLNYNYNNQFGRTFTGTDTFYVTVINPDSAPSISLYDLEMSPTSLKAGGTAIIKAKYENTGSQRAYNVKVEISGLSNEAISGINNITSQTVSMAEPSHIKEATFSIAAASGLKNGNYPLTFTTTYKDENGTDYKNEQTFFVNVGGEFGVTETADLQVSNFSAPKGVYGVGQSFNVSFDINNVSKGDAENVKVTANASEDKSIVPTSQSVIIQRLLKKGESKRFEFTFMATSTAKTQNHPISFTIEYEDGTDTSEGETNKITFYQYTGVNISNPDADDENGENDKQKNVPKIMINNYSCTPTIVNAGEQFDLSMTFINTHTEKIVKNIKIFLAVTDKDDKIGASIFSPVNASNSLYIGSIEPKGQVSRSIKYYAVPDAQPMTYTINVNFEYEDGEGNQLTASEIVGINVAQEPKLTTSEFEPPPFANMGEPIFISFDFYNEGKVSISNLKVTLEGEFDTQEGKSRWYGILEEGSSDIFEASILPREVGELAGKILITYDSPSGEHYKEEKEFLININDMPVMSEEEMMMMEGNMMPEQAEEGNLFTNVWFWVIVSVVVVIVVIVIILIVRKKRKNKQEGFDFDE